MIFSNQTNPAVVKIYKCIESSSILDHIKGCNVLLKENMKNLSTEEFAFLSFCLKNRIDIIQDTLIQLYETA